MAEGQKIGPILAVEAGGHGGGLDVLALGGGDFLDELGDAAVFLDDGFGGGVGRSCCRKKRMSSARADKNEAARSSAQKAEI